MSTNVHQLSNPYRTAGATPAHTRTDRRRNPLLALLRRAGQRVARARKRRLAIQELSALDDRQLYDIGLRREQIEEVVEATLQWHADSNR